MFRSVRELVFAHVGALGSRIPLRGPGRSKLCSARSPQPLKEREAGTQCGEVSRREKWPPGEAGGIGAARGGKRSVRACVMAAAGPPRACSDLVPILLADLSYAMRVYSYDMFLFVTGTRPCT